MIVMIFFEESGQGHKKKGDSNESPFRKENKENGRDRSTARLTLGVGLAVSAFPLSVPV